jgi:hypothetical protein
MTFLKIPEPTKGARSTKAEASSQNREEGAKFSGKTVTIEA